MELLVLFLAVLSGASAECQDLSEKLFTFPLDKGTSNVKLKVSREQPITALSLCMRYYSSRGQSLFSLAVPSEANAFLLFKPSANVYRLYVNGTHLNFNMQRDDNDEWRSVCCLWESASGLTSLWVDGKRSLRKIFQRGVTLVGAPSVILGQDQDSYGGGFEESQSFVGDITDVHLWDKILLPCEIRHYMDGDSITPGNLVSWTDLQYTITGSVYVQKSDVDKLSCY